MDIGIKEISKQQYNAEAFPILFEDDLYSRKYALVYLNGCTFRIAWSSDLIFPEVVELSSYIYGIGIDQNFGVLNFNNCSIVTKIKLIYNFYTIKVFWDYVFIITELKILKLDKNTLEIIDTYDLPDFFEEIQLHDNKLEVKCFGNNKIIINSSWK